MIRNGTMIALIMLLLAGSCKHIESENGDPNEMSHETEKMAVAYTFLLKKLQEDNLNLIASQDDKNVSLIRNIIRTNRLKLQLENYSNIEWGPDLCHYSKSTKKLVAIIDIEKKDEQRYYISYYLGPEGGASKEILIEKRNGKWAVVDDDGRWIVK
jgi:hypothetical protein